MRIGSDRSYAIGLYAWERHISCVVYFAKDTRRIPWKREKAVHVICRLGKSI